jgi:hypothetical protein
LPEPVPPSQKKLVSRRGNLLIACRVNRLRAFGVELGGIMGYILACRGM